MMSKKQHALNKLAFAFEAMLLARFGHEEIYTSIAFEFETVTKQYIMNVLIEKANGGFATLTVAFVSQDIDYIATKVGQFFGDDRNYITLTMMHSVDTFESITIRI